MHILILLFAHCINMHATILPHQLEPYQKTTSLPLEISNTCTEVVDTTLY